MSKSIIFFFFLFFSVCVFAQNTLNIQVSDSTTKEKLIGATVQIGNLGAYTDDNGFAQVNDIGNGTQNIEIEFLGYKKTTKTLSFPRLNPIDTLQVKMVSEEVGEEEVMITSTRTNSRIEDLPMKVEVLGIDDMEEENAIKPGSIASILGDLSVIHIQQTSQVNGNAAVRMQGLDGKYTQLLRDGLPLYEGFSGSFGVLQIPPLDLKQVEIIKGSVSTLYGGGAISGLINLVSKAPTDSQEVSLTLNQSSLRESNINGYFSKKQGKIGMTLFAGSTIQKAVDVNKDGFSDVPEITNALFHPKFFVFFSPKTNLNIGVTSLTENRQGGDMQVIQYKADSTHRYVEMNKSQRLNMDLHFTHNFTPKSNFSVKGTISSFNRSVNQSTFLFQGKQIISYSEASYFRQTSRHSLVGGLNLITENFQKKSSDSTALHDYDYKTVGAFVQDGWQVHEKFLIETGLRADKHNRYGWFILPRIAFLYKPKQNLSIRISSGKGYKTPNIFTQQTLSGSFRNLLPIDNTVQSESSLGINCDINYHTLLFEKLKVQLNQAFYFTNIYHPIIATINSNSQAFLSNANYNINSTGTDTYIRLGYEEFELYLGYNHTIAKHIQGDKSYVLFSPQDKFSSTLAYEIEGKWRMGIENSWVGNQYISATTKGKNYWFWAGMIEKKFRKMSIVLNCENIFDVRQSRFENIVIGTVSQPIFKSLYAPIDGRVINLAVRVRL